MHSHSHLFEKVQRTTRTHTQTQPHTHTHLPHILATHTHTHTPPAHTFRCAWRKVREVIECQPCSKPRTRHQPRPIAPSLFPPSSPGSRGCGESVPTAATVASVYPSCRASCRVSRQHSRATSNAVAHIRRLNDSFIHYFPALSSQLSLPFSLFYSLSTTLSPTRSACFFVCSQSHYTNLHISCMCFGQRRI